MISFVLFPQASRPSMNFDISELVYLKFAGSLVSILAITLINTGYNPDLK